MRPTENIEKLIKNTNIETNARTDDVVLDEVVRAFEESKKLAPSEVEGKESAITQPSIWRIIMKSRMTKLAAVAAVVLLFSLFSVNIIIKRFYVENDTVSQYPLRDNQHVITKIDTSPHYFLISSQNYYLNQKEMMPCNILPVLPSQF